MSGRISQQVPNPPRVPSGMVSLTPLTHLLCWEGWLHPLRGQQGTPGLPCFSCRTEGKTQSEFDQKSSCHVYQRHFQCCNHPTLEQGYVAKMLPLAKRCKRPFWSLSAPGRKSQGCTSASQTWLGLLNSKLVFHPAGKQQHCQQLRGVLLAVLGKMS